MEKREVKGRCVDVLEVVELGIAFVENFCREAQRCRDEDNYGDGQSILTQFRSWRDELMVEGVRIRKGWMVHVIFRVYRDVHGLYSRPGFVDLQVSDILDGKNLDILDGRKLDG